MAEDFGAPFVRREDGREDPDRRGLAGAVGTEEAEHGAGRNLEVDAIQGDDRPEPLSETLHEDGCITHARDPFTDT